MRRRIIVIGAGMGGLCAALRLLQAGFDVTTIEARHNAGGLASACTIQGHEFDSGPYILLDFPGLQWLFENLRLDLSNLKLNPVDPVYQVNFPDGFIIQFHRSLDETIEELEQSFPGSGLWYSSFVERMAKLHDALRPNLYRSHPGIWNTVRSGAWKHVPFLLRSLQEVMAHSGLPGRIMEALTIWTHVAGQVLETAPSPMAFVPAMIHRYGAYYPENGIRSIPELIASHVKRNGGEILFNTEVTEIVTKSGHVIGVRTEGEYLECDAVVSNAGGLATYLTLLKETPVTLTRTLQNLPLQSPGVCLYLTNTGENASPYLRFFLPGGSELCRLFVHSNHTARLIAPMRYADSQSMSSQEIQEFIEKILSENWWRSSGMDWRLLDARTPQRWGSEFLLYRQSMNPVMTGSSFRRGRLAHKSPWFEGLYLAGSATHPGQWVSFCGISGILAADLVKKNVR